MKMRHGLLLLLAMPLAAQTLIPPRIPQDLMTRYYKAHGESADARLKVATSVEQKALDEKVAAEQKVIEEMQKACGDKFVLYRTDGGDVVCQAKPEPKK